MIFYNNTRIIIVNEKKKKQTNTNVQRHSSHFVRIIAWYRTRQPSGIIRIDLNSGKKKIPRTLKHTETKLNKKNKKKH